MSPRPLRIALLTHSTNPRGGVVHALHLGESLTALGHRVTVYAPSTGKGFFRPVACDTQIIATTTLDPMHAHPLLHMVQTRVEDYLHHFLENGGEEYDVYHAGDGISGNALATLKDRGIISSFARTVHHIDDFSGTPLEALQNRSIAQADEILVVSDYWKQEVLRRYGRSATLVGNGVDLSHFRPMDRPKAEGPLFLSIGGVEERKNTLNSLNAFIEFRCSHPTARWIIAGGASVLDHQAYQAAFNRVLEAANLPQGVVTLAGPIAHDAVPALYRAADALLFPSVEEGFGLAVLEAMACGTPVIAPRIRPFTEYLGKDDVAWCDPLNPTSIAHAMHSATDPAQTAALIHNGHRVASAHRWVDVAAAHIPAYHHLLELAHA